MLRDFVRGWPMLAALGAGLVLTATAAGVSGTAGSPGGTGAGGVVVGAVLAGCGIAALGWAVFALRKGSLVAPRSALAVSLGVLGAPGALLATGAAAELGVAVLPMLAAGLFAIVVAVGAAVEIRRLRRRRRTALPPRRPAIGLVAGAALVAALATPALAGTAAGELAVPHGELHGTGHQHP
ncbi:hypothetical protein GCM10009748_26370 [Agromyces lapidis]